MDSTIKWSKMSVTKTQLHSLIEFIDLLTYDDDDFPLAQSYHTMIKKIVSSHNTDTVDIVNYINIIYLDCLKFQLRTYRKRKIIFILTRFFASGNRKHCKNSSHLSLKITLLLDIMWTFTFLLNPSQNERTSTLKLIPWTMVVVFVY